MTKLLEDALRAAGGLSPAYQDSIAHIVLRLAGVDDELPIPLDADERAATETSKAAAARAEFATDDQISAVWSKRGL